MKLKRIKTHLKAIDESIDLFEINPFEDLKIDCADQIKELCLQEFLNEFNDVDFWELQHVLHYC